MVLEVVCVDDNAMMLEGLCKYIKMFDLRPVAFREPSEVHVYLRTCAQPPAGYLVDIRIPDDLRGPESLFNEVKSSGYACAFSFITANLSAYDAALVERTGAQCILKNDLAALDTFLAGIIDGYRPRSLGAGA